METETEKRINFITFLFAIRMHFGYYENKHGKTTVYLKKLMRN